MTTYTDASRVYRTLGWPEVVPAKLAPESKKPAEGIHDVFGRGNAATEEQMEHWAVLFPERNCLLKMPKGVIGIDIDHYWKRRSDGSWEKKKGYDYLLEDIVRLGDLPATYSSTSRGPNQHSRILFYRVDQWIEFQPQPYTDVELIQNHHRYACVWPSIHPDTGQQYKWFDKDGMECPPPRPSELATLPAEWYEPLLTKRRSNVGHAASRKTSHGGDLREIYSGPAEDWVDSLDTSEMSMRMHLFLNEIENRANPHIGHDELLSLLGKLHYLQFARHETGARSVFDLILDNYLKNTNETKPIQELSNAIKYVAGKDFVPCLL